MVARMRNDGYIDLSPDFPYEIDKVLANGYIKLKHSPRRYRVMCFKLYHNDKQITYKEAYRLYRLQCIKTKFRMN